MASTPVTPIPGLATTIVTGGTPIAVIDVLPEGGIITNPASVADQGIGGGAPESIYVDPTGADPTIGAFGTTFEVVPGGSWECIAGQTSVTKINAATTGHRISAVQWKDA